MVFELYFQVRNSIFKFLLHFNDVKFQVFNFLLMRGVYFKFSSLSLTFIIFKISDRLLFLLFNRPLKIFNHLLCICIWFLFFKSIFILFDNCITIIHNGVNFFFISVCQSCSKTLVFFILCMKMKNDFCKLSNLFTHL